MPKESILGIATRRIKADPLPILGLQVQRDPSGLEQGSMVVHLKCAKGSEGGLRQDR